MKLGARRGEQAATWGGGGRGDFPLSQNWMWSPQGLNMLLGGGVGVELARDGAAVAASCEGLVLSLQWTCPPPPPAGLLGAAPSDNCLLWASASFGGGEDSFCFWGGAVVRRKPSCFAILCGVFVGEEYFVLLLLACRYAQARDAGLALQHPSPLPHCAGHKSCTDWLLSAPMFVCRYAQARVAGLDMSRHHMLQTTHPSGLSAHKVGGL